MKEKRKIFVGIIITIMICSVSFGATLVVKKSPGVGEYSTITAAIAVAAGSGGGTIEVQDNATYNELLTFTASDITVQAGTGSSPTIETTGTPTSPYHQLAASTSISNSKLKGFVLIHNGAITGSSVYLKAAGASNGTAVENCTIIGAGTTTRGLNNIRLVKNVEISGFGYNIYSDSSAQPNITFTNIYSHNTGGTTGVGFYMSNTGQAITIQNATFTTSYRCMRIMQGATGTTNITVSDSIFDNIGAGNSNCIETEGGISTFNNCVIKGSQGALFLEKLNTNSATKTINFNYCILTSPTARGCIESTGSTATTINVDHCDLVSVTGQPAVLSSNSLATSTITNSIITGAGDGLSKTAGAITSNYSDIFVSGTAYGAGISAGANDINPGIDPKYVQTNNSTDGYSFFHLRSDTSANNAVKTGSSTAGPMGSQGIGVPVELLDFSAE